MDIVHNAKELTRYMHEAIVVSEDSPVLLDHFLDDAVKWTLTPCATATKCVSAA